jgi:hypothetical protein
VLFRSENSIQELVPAIKGWMDSQAVEEQVQEDGTIKIVMGAETKDILSKLRTGNKEGVERTKENKTAKEKYQLENYDLITWFLVSV